MRWEVAEIFYSIQGEGYFVGTPAIFIRFSTCNLNCSFCDEKNLKIHKYDFEMIFKEVKKYPSKFLILTGGEPLYQENISYFIEEMIKKGYFVAIETNGTLSISVNEKYRKKLWLTVSPKTLNFLKFANEYKFLYDIYNEYLLNIWEYVQKDIENLYKITPHIFLQPVYYEDEKKYFNNINKSIEIVKKYPQYLKLSVQMHKFLGIK